jgi:hypothetical protein
VIVFTFRMDIGMKYYDKDSEIYRCVLYYFYTFDIIIQRKHKSIYHSCMLRTDWLVYCVARFAATVGNGFSNGNVGFGEARMSSLSFHATLANPLCFFPLPTPDL